MTALSDCFWAPYKFAFTLHTWASLLLDPEYGMLYLQNSDMTSALDSLGANWSRICLSRTLNHGALWHIDFLRLGYILTYLLTYLLTKSVRSTLPCSGKASNYCHGAVCRFFAMSASRTSSPRTELSSSSRCWTRSCSLLKRTCRNLSRSELNSITWDQVNK